MVGLVVSGSLTIQTEVEAGGDLHHHPESNGISDSFIDLLDPLGVYPRFGGQAVSVELRVVDGPDSILAGDVRVCGTYALPVEHRVMYDDGFPIPLAYRVSQFIGSVAHWSLRAVVDANDEHRYGDDEVFATLERSGLGVGHAHLPKVHGRQR